MENIMTAIDVLNCNGARIVVILTGRLVGPVATISEKSPSYDETKDSCLWSYLEAVRNKKGDIVDYKRIFKKINHTPRETTTCQKVIPLTPEQIKVMINEKPLAVRKKEWDTMNKNQKFMANIATFNEGNGVKVELF